jgi:hypothetical protein
LYLSSEDNGKHSLIPSGNSAGSVEVECVTLSQVFKENNIDYVDFLKMDCEGAEYEILKAMEEETGSKIGRIAMEYHFRPRQEFTELLNHLKFDTFEYESKKRNSLYIMASKRCS